MTNTCDDLPVPGPDGRRMVDIVRCEAGDLEAWARLRHALWPRDGLAHHRAALLHTLQAPGRTTGILARDADGTVVGFAEATLRTDYVAGRSTTPVAFLEGLYVQPDRRRSGLARRLCLAVERWAHEHGCREFASDADLANKAAQAMHQALGFSETERVVCYRRSIGPDPS